MFSKKIQKMIDYAFKESSMSTHKFKVGCVLFDKNIIAKSPNSNKTCPHLPGLVNKLHAEMKVLKYIESPIGAHMIVVRGTKENPLLAKPCQHCIGYIKRAGIKRVTYSINNGFETIKI